MKRAERPLYPLRRTKDEDRDAPADDALVSLYDLSVPKTPSIWIFDRQRIRTYCWMFAIAFLFVRVLCDGFKSRRRLEAEILVLRHQVNVLQQRAPRRLYLTWIDRVLFVWLYRGFPHTLDAIMIVRPETIVRWHRKGFSAFWRWKSRPLGGRLLLTQSGHSRLHRTCPLLGVKRTYSRGRRYHRAVPRIGAVIPTPRMGT
jgi:hypothetical protein